MKAPRLRDVNGERSDLEVRSGDAVAAVRGTVFGVRASGTLSIPPTPSDVGVPSVGAEFTLIEGKIAMKSESVGGELTVDGLSGNALLTGGS